MTPTPDSEDLTAAEKRLDHLQDRIDQARHQLDELKGTDDEIRFSDDGEIEGGAGSDMNVPPG